MTTFFDYDRYARDGRRRGEEQSKQRVEFREQDANRDQDPRREESTEDTRENTLVESSQIRSGDGRRDDEKLLLDERHRRHRQTQTSPEILPTGGNTDQSRKRKHREQPQSGPGMHTKG